MTAQNQPKNVIFIIIDTLRFDHIGFGGYDPSPSPTLDRLMAQGLSTTLGFATGCPTSMALPGIFSSTLPLDRGGYDLGITKRYDSMVEIFKGAGYRTIGFYPGIETDGYERSFDLFFRTVFPSFISSSLNYHMRPVLETYIKTKKSIGDCITMLSPAVAACFRDIKSYCIDKKSEVSCRSIIESPFMHECGFDYMAVHDLVDSEEKKFHSNPSKYVKKLIRTVAFSLLAKKILKIDWGKKNNLLDKLISLENDIKEKNQARADQYSQAHRENSFFRFDQFVSNIASAGYIMQNLQGWIDSGSGQPFFSYVHLFDVHPPCNFISYDVQNGHSTMGHEIDSLRQFHSRIGSTGKSLSDKSVRYLLSIKYVDDKIKELIAYLENRKILDNTVLVITSDHGTNYPGIPSREDVHVIKSFYDEFYRIPILFFNRDIAARTFRGLCSSMDIAPTLLDLVGLEIPRSFKGVSFAGTSDTREYVIMEHMGAGLCDFVSKPVLISLRTKNYKCVYEIFLYPSKRRQKGRIKQFFDVQSDPFERHNLANAIPGTPLEKPARDLISIAEARAVEIKREAERLSGLRIS